MLNTSDLQVPTLHSKLIQRLDLGQAKPRRRVTAPALIEPGSTKDRRYHRACLMSTADRCPPPSVFSFFKKSAFPSRRGYLLHMAGDDLDLLRNFSRDHSQDAFTAL